MPSINVELTPDMADFVAAEVESGGYANGSELVRHALLLLRRDSESEAEQVEILRRELDFGIAEADWGDFSRRTASEIAAEVLAGDA